MTSGWLLLVHVGIGVGTWSQVVLSLNRYTGFGRMPTLYAWALLVNLNAAVQRWLASIAVVHASLAMQMSAALLAATLAWTAFCLVFNAGFYVPTRQQLFSLLISLCITSLWELSNRLLLEV